MAVPIDMDREVNSLPLGGSITESAPSHLIHGQGDVFTWVDTNKCQM